ncbi:hypothetical protein D5S17_26850 [Pseudonocardiaceae bacterium YIM PH 21723]|nr:hypothetical protein D5S17_26850 [Pseudonocardiaceae bacterium YIM PH 21723]
MFTSVVDSIWVASCTKVVLQDLANAVCSGVTPRSNPALWNSCPAMKVLPGQGSTVFGWARPLSSAAAAVTIL